jgi:mannose-1-phosphate guanylyltransferase
MKIIIFAGGIGTRLWPLSRRSRPKQFLQNFDGRSTLQLAVERVAPVFGYENIYLQTTPEFKHLVKKQLPELAEANIILEPERRNVAPAVCLAALHLSQNGYDGPVAILWADHLMEKPADFIKTLQAAEQIIQQRAANLVFMAEQPRYANHNLGWLKVGEKIGKTGERDYFKFLGWKYKPVPADCERMFNSGEYFWNPGYFITSVDFLITQYKKLAPEIYRAVRQGDYSASPAQSFDRAIIEKVDLNQAAVLKTDLGWSDPGTLYALKEVLAAHPTDNVIQGQAYDLDSQDCLIYNLEDKKLATTIGLNGMVIINTPDVLLVLPKNEVKRLTELLTRLQSSGWEKFL